jgi:hypothetical protein
MTNPESEAANTAPSDGRFKLLTKLIDFWIVFGALVLLILVLSFAFVLWAVV